MVGIERWILNHSGNVRTIIVAFSTQYHAYKDGIDNLLLLLIGGIAIAVLTVLPVALTFGSSRVS